MQAEARSRQANTLLRQQTPHAAVHRKQLPHRHSTLGGGGLVGHADQDKAGPREQPRRGGRPGDEAHVTLREGRLQMARERVEHQLVEYPVAIQEDGRTSAHDDAGTETDLAGGPDSTRGTEPAEDADSVEDTDPAEDAGSTSTGGTNSVVEADPTGRVKDSQ